MSVNVPHCSFSFLLYQLNYAFLQRLSSITPLASGTCARLPSSMMTATFHKLTADDGCEYPHRQAAAADSTERGASSVSDYYYQGSLGEG